MISFKKLLPKLLTPTEEDMLKKRYQIVKLLQSGVPYRDIAKKLNISTTTIVRLKKNLESQKEKDKLPENQPPSRPGTQTSKKLPWVIG